MNAQKVEMYLMINSKYFKNDQIPSIKKRMLEADDNAWANVESCRLYDPVISFCASLFGGTIGIDRFMIGDAGLAVGKMLTFGGCCIWAIIDWFLIIEDTKEKNMYNLIAALRV